MGPIDHRRECRGKALSHVLVPLGQVLLAHDVPCEYGAPDRKCACDAIPDDRRVRPNEVAREDGVRLWVRHIDIH